MPNYYENVNVLSPGNLVIINSGSPSFYTQTSSGLAGFYCMTSTYPGDSRLLSLIFDPSYN